MRLFFALVPDPPVRNALGALAQGLQATIGGRAVPAHNIHLTLAFIGETDLARAAQLRAVLGVLPRVAFTLTLDRLGEWRHADVAWIAPSVVGEAPAALHAALADALRAAAFPVEDRPFRPHVTLVRRPARRLATAASGPLAWPVTRVSLMRSQSIAGHVRYREDAGMALDA